MPQSPYLSKGTWASPQVTPWVANPAPCVGARELPGPSRHKGLTFHSGNRGTVGRGACDLGTPAKFKRHVSGPRKPSRSPASDPRGVASAPLCPRTGAGPDFSGGGPALKGWKRRAGHTSRFPSPVGLGPAPGRPPPRAPTPPLSRAPAPRPLPPPPPPRRPATCPAGDRAAGTATERRGRRPAHSLPRPAALRLARAQPPPPSDNRPTVRLP